MSQWSAQKANIVKNKHNNMKKIFNILVFVLLFIWQLPQNLVALCMLPTFKTLKLISYDNYNYCFEETGMAGGISLGSFCFISKYITDNPAIVAHEQRGHVTQSHILGPLYLLVIGLPSLIWCMTYRKLGYDNYNVFYTESWANKIAKVEPHGKYYTLRFIQNKELN